MIKWEEGGEPFTFLSLPLQTYRVLLPWDSGFIYNCKRRFLKARKISKTAFVNMKYTIIWRKMWQVLLHSNVLFVPYLFLEKRVQEVNIDKWYGKDQPSNNTVPCWALAYIPMFLQSKLTVIKSNLWYHQLYILST